MPFVPPGDAASLISDLSSAFAAAYGNEPVVVARAPGRVNLIGEHTDYNGGLVLPVALPHATYAALAPRDDDLVRVGSLQESAPWSGSLDSAAAATGWAAYAAGTLWALREDGVALPGVDVLVGGTVPLGAGLSSSAALECSVAVAACAAAGVTLERQRVVDACIRAETDVARAPTGGMDQTVSMLAEAGAALLIDFDAGSSRPVPLMLAEAGLALLVTDTRVTHALVDGGYGERRADCEAAAAALGVPSLRRATSSSVDSIPDDRLRRRARHVVTEIERVRGVVDALGAGDWTTVGACFAESHLSMRDDFEISCPELDLVVDTAVESGALGARMTGGGFGGSALSLVPVARLDAVVQAIDGAFSAAGLQAPQHLVAEPAAGAERLR